MIIELCGNNCVVAYTSAFICVCVCVCVRVYMHVCVLVCAPV